MTACSRRLISLCLALLAIVAIIGCGTPRQQKMIYYSGTPWVEGRVNGRSGIFLVDTGASMTVLDAELAREAGIRGLEEQEILATTGSLRLPRGRANRIDLAGLRHYDRYVTIQDMRSFRAPGGRPQAGLLGTDFFLEYTLVFDMSQSRFVITPNPAPMDTGMRSFRMEMDAGVPMIEAWFGQEPESRWVRLDSGMGYGSERFVYIEMGEATARQLIGNRLDGPPLGTARVTSLAGQRELRIYEYGPVRLLGSLLPSIRLVIHDHGEGLFADEREIVVSGNLLNQFSRVEIDFPRRRIWVR